MESGVQAMKGGAVDFLEKPFSAQALRRRRALARSTWTGSAGSPMPNVTLLLDALR